MQGKDDEPLVVEVDHGLREDGWYSPDEHVVVLRRGLGRVRQRCVLEHELVHARDGHIPVGGPDAGRLQRRVERAVDAAAAARLITDAALDAAMRWVADLGLSGYAWLSALADELDVDVPTLRARLARL